MTTDIDVDAIELLLSVSEHEEMTDDAFLTVVGSVPALIAEVRRLREASAAQSRVYNQLHIDKEAAIARAEAAEARVALLDGAIRPVVHALQFRRMSLSTSSEDRHTAESIAKFAAADEELETRLVTAVFAALALALDSAQVATKGDGG